MINMIEDCREALIPILTEVADGLVFGGGTGSRAHFVGSLQAGYDVVFEQKAPDDWQQAARFPTGQVWSVYSDWRESWYAVIHHAG